MRVVEPVTPVGGPVLPPPPAPLEDTPLSWRLWSRRDFWSDELCPPKYILRIIQEGYRLPFVSYPPHTFRRNSRKCRGHEDFIDSAIAALLANGSIVEVAHQPRVVCSLSVDDSKAQLRLIYNAIPVNPHLFKERFRYESLNTLRDVLPRNGRLYQFDIHSAFPHIRVVRDHWGCLGFWWRGRWYVYCVLPFGLSTAPYVFTKVMRPLLAFWRARGTIVAMYLDDGVGAAATEAKTRADAALVQWTLRAAGFTAHATKSRWEPAASTDAFLGFSLDLVANLLGLKSTRVAKFAKAISALSRDRPIRRRTLASLAGQLQSMADVLGPVVRLHTRAIYVLGGGGVSASLGTPQSSGQTRRGLRLSSGVAWLRLGSWPGRYPSGARLSPRRSTWLAMLVT